MFSKESVHLSAEIKHTKESHNPYLLAVPARGVHTDAKARMRTIDKVGPFALVQPGNGKRQTDLPLSSALPLAPVPPLRYRVYCTCTRPGKSSKLRYPSLLLTCFC